MQDGLHARAIHSTLHGLSAPRQLQTQNTCCSSPVRRKVWAGWGTQSGNTVHDHHTPTALSSTPTCCATPPRRGPRRGGGVCFPRVNPG